MQGVLSRTTGQKVTWSAEHRDGKGNLVVRMADVTPPALPDCINPKCWWNFFWDVLEYHLIISYHSRRVKYAESHRGKKILDRYRTGEHGPETFWRAIFAHIKLSCPVCRKFETGWP